MKLIAESSLCNHPTPRINYTAAWKLIVQRQIIHLCGVYYEMEDTN